ncbi:30S ribosomal protein S1 [Ferviditalea candida]|uniref:30S ribosomal protein S1 n=1 Tax=Ferviditalea candida TaxID=3108399 RepID=A0ABU5ZJW4_9BACL|nr:30S ribosomal protein S1 [Paenibacillaceae bacterium T2]
MTEETKLQETGASVEPAQDNQAASEATAETGASVGEQPAEVNEQQSVDDLVTLKKGDIVKGKVVKVEDNQVLVDVGYKYDGVIPIRELSSLHLENAAESVSVGQEVESKVVSINDDKELLVLSKRAVDSVKAWERLERLLETGEVIEAQVAEVVKGGLVVDLGVRGFVPASMVERHFVEDFSDYKNRTLRLKIKELDRESNKVILSQKDVLDEEYESQKRELFSRLQANQVLEGTVQRLTPFGAFVDIGGVDGLVHISELSWNHVDHPSEVVKEGDHVKVKVLKVDPENERISLSIKAAQPGPWESVQDQFKSGDIVTGTVKRLVNFGAFVEIAPGVEGLVHISQISHKHIGTPNEVLKEGQEVKVKILDLNPSEKRASLSIKETEEARVAPPKTRKEEQEILKNDNVSMNSSAMTLTLGERFGDKLNKLK